MNAADYARLNSTTGTHLNQVTVRRLLNSLLQEDLPIAPLTQTRSDPILDDRCTHIYLHFQQLFPPPFHDLLSMWSNETVGNKPDATIVQEAKRKCEIALRQAMNADTMKQDPDTLALCDRAFMQLSCIWLYHTESCGTPAFNAFDACYRQWRNGGFPQQDMPDRRQQQARHADDRGQSLNTNEHR